jgi:hypothetical protein
MMLISYSKLYYWLRKQIDGEYYNDMKLDTSHLRDGREKKYDSLSLAKISLFKIIIFII